MLFSEFSAVNDLVKVMAAFLKTTLPKARVLKVIIFL